MNIKNQKKQLQVKSYKGETWTTYTIVYGAMPHNYDAFVNAELSKISMEMMQVGSPKALKILLNLHEKYPHIPIFMNNIAVCYEAQGKLCEANKYLEKMYQTCPDYLFGRFARAFKALDEGRIEDVPSIFNNCFNLKDLYPERDSFHITEMLSFTYIIGMYLCFIGDIKAAEVYCRLLEELAGKDEERAQILSELIRARVRLDKAYKKE